jgi:hypothetical protein
MSTMSQASFRIPPVAKQSMTRLLAEAKRAGVSPEEYARNLVEDALALQREAEDLTFEQIMRPVRRATGKVSDAEIVRIVHKARVITD